MLHKFKIIKYIIIMMLKAIEFRTGLPKIFIELSKYINSNYIDNTTKLHRWCHTACVKYRKWEMKLDNANKDNSL